MAAALEERFVFSAIFLNIAAINVFEWQINLGRFLKDLVVKGSLLTSPQVPKTTQCGDSHPCADPALLFGLDGNSRRSGFTGSAEAHLSGNAGDGAVPPQHIPEMSQPTWSHAAPEDPLTGSGCLCSSAPLSCPQQTRPSQAV